MKFGEKGIFILIVGLIHQSDIVDCFPNMSTDLLELKNLGSEYLSIDINLLN